MPIPTIVAFLFDAENEAKLDWHGISTYQVEEVLMDDDRRIVRNRKGRRATHLVVGRDRSGRCIAIPVEPTQQPTLWRPVTAWDCKESERALLPRGR